MMRFSKRKTMIAASVLSMALVLAAGAAWINRGTEVTVPLGTPLRVALDQSLTSEQHRAGDEFQATVLDPIEVNGEPAILAGSRVRGVIVDARESGRLAGVARLRLELSEVQVGDDWYDVETSSVSYRGGDHKKRNWIIIGGSAATGTLIGALAAGGKGALIGGPVGAGAGVAAAAITGKKNIRIPAERVMTFKLTEPLTVPLFEPGEDQ
ncbi:MAG TPA: hypothetical protein VGA40_02950 [Candidatus Acidoferrales bacterium]